MKMVAANESLAAASFTVQDRGGLFVPFGDFPQVVLLKGENLAQARRKGMRVGADGRAVVLQRVDAEAGAAMANELASLLGKAKRFFMGAPVYEGHPFHPDPAEREKHPNKRAMGWIKAITVEEEGVRFDADYNSLGAEAVNDAQLVYHSPEWGMEFVGVENGVGVYRPVTLRSTGLVNEPNIPVPALVAGNEGDGRWEMEDGRSEMEDGEDALITVTAELLKAANQADFAPLAARLRAALESETVEALNEALTALRADLPELAREVAASSETVAAWEALLGAAAANGLAEIEEEFPTTQENDMLKKILEALAEAGITKPDDNEDTVLSAVGSLIQSLAWRREEAARQKQSAQSLRASLPAANIAELPEDELSTELITAAANEVTTLRERLTALEQERDHAQQLLIEDRVEALVSANIITGAEVESTTQDLLDCANEEAMQERLQELRDRAASGVQTRVSAGANKPAVVAANDQVNASQQRAAVVQQHIDRLTGRPGAKPSPAQYDRAWVAAANERPDLFEGAAK